MSITATFASGTGITASFGNQVINPASQDEVNTGTNTSKFVNPAKLAGSKYVVGTLTDIVDGATPAIDCLNYDQAKVSWSTSEGTPAPTISNFGDILLINIEKNIAGDTVVTLSVTGYKLVDLDSDNDTVAATVDITLSGGNPSYYEISIESTSFDGGGGDLIAHVTSKL